MRTRIDLDIVLVGRLLGVAIIAGGILSAALDASLNSNALRGSHGELRYFLLAAPFLVWNGGILIAAAEIVDRVIPNRREGRIDWNATALVNAIGAAIIIAGLGVTVWNLREEHISHPSRYVLRVAIQYVFEGGLLFVLAGLASRMGADAPDEQDEGDSEAVPAAQPPAPPTGETSAVLP